MSKGRKLQKIAGNLSAAASSRRHIRCSVERVQHSFGARRREVEKGAVGVHTPFAHRPIEAAIAFPDESRGLRAVGEIHKRIDVRFHACGSNWNPR